MRKFNAEGWYEIKERGLVVSVVNDEEFAKDSSHLIGEIVRIDGVEYKVKGVEAHALATIRKGAPIGLLVERLPSDALAKRSASSNVGEEESSNNGINVPGSVL